MRPPRNYQAENVTKIVPSVGKQRDRICNDAVEHLDDNQPQVKGGCNREHRSKIIRCLPMAMAVVIVHCRDIASDAQVTLLRYPQGFGLMVLIRAAHAKI